MMYNFSVAAIIFWLPIDIQTVLYDNSLNVNCFCLMHFNMKVLKLERGRCSAVYKALLYFVLKIVLALREKRTTVDFSNSNQCHSGLSVCSKSIMMDRNCHYHWI